MGAPVMRWQILSQDPEATVGFYTELFDWSVNDDNPLGARMVDTGSDRGIQGNIWPSPPEAHSFVQLHVQVEDVRATLEKAVQLGGHVVVPPQVLPEGDEMAVIVDPQGIPVGLFRAAR